MSFVRGNVHADDFIWFPSLLFKQWNYYLLRFDFLKLVNIIEFDAISIAYQKAIDRFDKYSYSSIQVGFDDIGFKVMMIIPFMNFKLSIVGLVGDAVFDF